MLHHISIPHFFKTFVSTRHFSSQIQKRDGPEPTSQPPQELAKVNPFKRRILVWAGVYKNVNEVPDMVSRKTMMKTMDRFRVRFTLALVVISGLGALSSILLAKNTLDEIDEEKNKQK